MSVIRKAALFDLYGTLADVRVDEENPRFWDALALETFIPGRYITGRELRERYMRLLHEMAEEHAEGFMLDAVFAGLLASCDIDPVPGAVAAFARTFRRLSLARLEKKPYTDDLLSAIRNAGYALGLVSNTEALLTDYDLEILGLHDRFDAVVLSSRVGYKKPDRRIFDLALERLGIAASECVFVGDNPVDDIAGAQGAGMDALYLAGEAAQPVRPTAGRRVLQASFNLEEILAALRELGFRIAL